MAASTAARGDNRVETFTIGEQEARRLLAGLHYGRALDPIKFTHERLTKTMNDLSFLTDSDAGDLDDAQAKVFRALTGTLAGRGLVVVRDASDADAEPEDEDTQALIDDYEVEPDAEDTAASSASKEEVRGLAQGGHVSYRTEAKSAAQTHLAEAMTRLAQAQTEMAQALRVMAAQERAEWTSAAEAPADRQRNGRRAAPAEASSEDQPRRRGRPRKNEVEPALAVREEEDAHTEKTKRAPVARAKRTRGGRADAMVLDEAQAVLQEAGRPLDGKTLAKRIVKRGAWKTSNQTPWITVSGLIHKDMRAKGARSRFCSSGRGVFALC